MAIADAASPTNPSRRTAELSKRAILETAAVEFAEHGLNGARIDVIAQRSGVNKSLLYLYFENKTKLFQAVLRTAYARIRAIEHRLDLDGISPLDALARLTAATFDHHVQNEYFIRLVMVENLHLGQNVSGMPEIVALNGSAVDHLSSICRRGVEDGSLRADLDPLQLHISIAALCFFNVSNRHTVAVLMNYDSSEQAALSARKAAVIDMIIASSRASPGGLGPATRADLSLRSLSTVGTSDHD